MSRGWAKGAARFWIHKIALHTRYPKSNIQRPQALKSFIPICGWVVRDLAKRPESCPEDFGKINLCKFII